MSMLPSWVGEEPPHEPGGFGVAAAVVLILRHLVADFTRNYVGTRLNVKILHSLTPSIGGLESVPYVISNNVKLRLLSFKVYENPYNFGRKKNWRIFLGLVRGRTWRHVVFPSNHKPVGIGLTWDTVHSDSEGESDKYRTHNNRGAPEEPSITSMHIQDTQTHFISGLFVFKTASLRFLSGACAWPEGWYVLRFVLKRRIRRSSWRFLLERTIVQPPRPVSVRPARPVQHLTRPVRLIVLDALVGFVHEVRAVPIGSACGGGVRMGHPAADDELVRLEAADVGREARQTEQGGAVRHCPTHAHLAALHGASFADCGQRQAMLGCNHLDPEVLKEVVYKTGRASRPPRI
uniref:Uncharacterized protein n=1 Tax=Timema poppense TaxID=170557 RepID=A0A7R9CU40_TIMPO|nr:unnamed protein product [Timema poppensis]